MQTRQERINRINELLGGMDDSQLYALDLTLKALLRPECFRHPAVNSGQVLKEAVKKMHAFNAAQSLLKVCNHLPERIDGRHLNGLRCASVHQPGN